MSDIADSMRNEPQSNAISRRDLIKGVILGGVAASSASYLFRASQGRRWRSSLLKTLLTVDQWLDSRNGKNVAFCPESAEI
jgi:gas vesicle protein